MAFRALLNSFDLHCSQSPFAKSPLERSRCHGGFQFLDNVTRSRHAIVATTPLTNDEQWTTLEPGTLWLFEEGDVKTSCQDCGRTAKSPRLLIIRGEVT